MRFHYLHGSRLPALGIANQMDGAEIATPDLLQQLILVHSSDIIMYNHSFTIPSFPQQVQH
jgi:hypothetical protein